MMHRGVVMFVGKMSLKDARRFWRTKGWRGTPFGIRQWLVKVCTECGEPFTGDAAVYVHAITELVGCVYCFVCEKCHDAGYIAWGRNKETHARRFGIVDASQCEHAILASNAKCIRCWTYIEFKGSRPSGYRLKENFFYRRC